ncbi:hypothetical protein BAY59_10780 [Prauserella coralliicola]|nr:hypothetical protein BAY59_10780 [Prauserella coralliicola]
MTDDDLLRSAPPARLDAVDVCRALDVAPEFRAADEGDGSPGTMVGHFSVFDHWYEINSWFEGHFLERIAPGAFKRTIKNRSGETPVRVLLEHGFDPTVGDKPLGVHSVLDERDGGGYSEVPLFDTSYNRDLAPALAAGAYGKSFRFQVLRDEWVEEPEPSEHNPKGIPERTIKEVRLIEEGPTVFPANPAATADLRSGLRSTTDQFYERLRSRDPNRYDSALRSARSARIPDAAPADPPPTQHSDDPPSRHSEDPPPTRHSETPPAQPSNADRSVTMDAPMTVEERAARQSEIRARLTEIDTEYNGAALPDEVRTEWDQLNAEHEEHDRAIADATERRNRLAQLADEPRATERVSNRPAVRRPENIYDLAEVRNQARSIDELPQLYRDNAMRAVEQARFPGVDDRARAQAQVERLLNTVDDEHGTLARRILVTGSPTYDRAFGKAAKALSTNGLTAEEQRALSLGVDTEGGYAVPFDLDPTVILTSDGVIDPLRQMARVEQIMGKEWQGITSAGVTVTRKAEKAQATDDSPSVDQPACRTSRVDGFIQFSVEIDADWTRMRSEMTTLLADAKATEEADSFVNGDGTANAGTGTEPGGVLATLAATSNVETATAGAFVSDDLFTLEEAVPPRFRKRARWLAQKSFYNAARQLGADSDGGDLWVRLRDGLPPELIGYAIAEGSEMPSFALTNGSKLALLGDFAQFLIVDRVGMSVELVPHIFGANQRPTGQRGLWAFWRNGSKVLVDNAFRLLVINDGV